MKQQMSQWQFNTLMTLVVVGNGILFVPSAIAFFVVRDGWISAGLLMVSIVVLSAIAVLYVHTFASQSLVHSLIITFGPWFGRFLALFFIIWIFISTCMFLRKFTFYVTDTLLPLTPPNLIALLFIVPIAYAVWQGIEVMGRIAVILTPLAIVATLGFLVLTSRQVHLTQLTPVLADGWTPVLRGAVIPWRFSTELMLCLMFLQDVKNPATTLGKNLLLMGLIMTLFGIVLEGIIVAILGQQVTYSEYPVLEAVKTIQFGEFFGRLDSLYAIGTIGLLVAKLTVYEYAFLLSLKDFFYLTSYRSIALSGTFALWAGTMFFFHDLPSLDEYGANTVPAFFIAALVVLPLISILGAQILKWIGKFLRKTSVN